VRAATIVAIACGLSICPAFSVDAADATAADESTDRHRASTATHGSIVTPREADVLRCVARGYNRDQTCRELKISPKTYDVHTDKARKALGVHTTKLAASRALLMGLL